MYDVKQTSSHNLTNGKMCGYVAPMSLFCDLYPLQQEFEMTYTTDNK